MFSRSIYSKIDRTYWLRNIQLRYDLGRRIMDAPRPQVPAGRIDWRTHGQLPTPEQLSIPPEPGQAAAIVGVKENMPATIPRLQRTSCNSRNRPFQGSPSKISAEDCGCTKILLIGDIFHFLLKNISHNSNICSIILTVRVTKSQAHIFVGP